MDAMLSGARAFHIGALIFLNGIFVFLVFIARPAFAGAASARSPHDLELRRVLTQSAWIGLTVALVSAIPWLVLQAASMSGQTMGRVLAAPGVVGTVLLRTRFGADFIWRFFILAGIAVVLCAVQRRGGGTSDPRYDRGGWLLSTLALAVPAWAGHAGATVGWPGDLHLLSDVAHLLAAGAWLGGLIPLALLLAQARRSGDATRTSIAGAAVRRFSTLGLASVGVLLTTGVVNTGFLAGSIGALVGTPYGQLVLAKFGLFLIMVGIAAVNRFRETPRLAAAPAASGAESALNALRRNAFLEAGIGVGIVLIVGALGITPPGSHIQPWWPFSSRPSLEPLDEVPGARGQAIAAGAIAAIGCVLLVYGVLRRRYRRWALALGAVVCTGATWRLLQVLSVAANPTTFQFSPVPYATASIAHGAQSYAVNCVVCHGEDGRGDGPAADSLRVRPADLTDAHVFGHPLGDFFWWISHGTPNGVMPGFADRLDERTRWDLINFVRARAAGVQSRDMGTMVTDSAAPEAPDFAFEGPDGRQGTLASARAHGAVLLVFFTLPSSMERLAELERTSSELTRLGIQPLAVPMNPSARVGAVGLPTFVVRTGSDVPRVYALYARRHAKASSDHVEFLIDRDGYLRARWQLGDIPSWRDWKNLATDSERLKHLPPVPLVGSHEH
jgi:putative copper export protein/mono/diheme cytochrome c family protein